MPLDLEKMEELARKATPGPWIANQDDDVPEERGSPFIDVLHGDPIGTSGHLSWEVLCSFNENRNRNLLEQMVLNAQFVAACSPERILALTAIAKAAKRVADETRCSPVHNHLDWCELYDALQALEQSP